LVARMLKHFVALLKCLSILHNYFDDLTKLFPNLYSQFLDISEISFFLSTITYLSPVGIHSQFLYLSLF